MSCASINIHTLDANSLTSLLLGFPFSSNESVSCQTYLTIGFNIFFVFFCFFHENSIKLEEKE